MPGEVVCFCGQRFRLRVDAGRCPNCGEYVSLNPKPHAISLEEMDQYQAWLDSLPVREG